MTAFDARPSTGALTRTTPAPLPTSAGGVVCPKATFVPHSNHARVANPLGTTMPLSTALVELTGAAGWVAAYGLPMIVTLTTAWVESISPSFAMYPQVV